MAPDRAPLALSILGGLRRHGSTELLQAVRYERVESNPNRLQRPSRRVRKGRPYRTPGDHRLAVERACARSPGVVPCPRVPRRAAGSTRNSSSGAGKLLEVFVAWRHDFVEVTAEPSTPDLASRLADVGDRARELPEGQVAEIASASPPWVDEWRRLGARLFVIAIDYGHPPPELYGPAPSGRSLSGYRRSSACKRPVRRIGLTDLTAHCRLHRGPGPREGRGSPFRGLTTQANFLRSTGRGLRRSCRRCQASPETDRRGQLFAPAPGIVCMLGPPPYGPFPGLYPRAVYPR